MAEPFQAELQAAIDAAGLANALDDRAGVALAGSFYKDFKTGQVVTTYGPGWQELMRVSPAGGYDGVALMHPKSRTLVVLNRGTEGMNSLDDWRQNIGAALFDNPGRQMEPAMKLIIDGFHKAGGANVDRILICGHSLGGALADAQGALAKSLFAKNGLTCPPLKVVGVASAGFGNALQKYAADRGLQIAGDAEGFITHFVRKRDVVPNHPKRKVFGTDRLVASIFESRNLQSHKGGWEWRWVADIPKQHKRTLYLQFLDKAGDGHIWWNDNKSQYAFQAGARPAWTRKLRDPDT